MCVFSMTNVIDVKYWFIFDITKITTKSGNLRVRTEVGKITVTYKQCNLGVYNIHVFPPDAEGGLLLSDLTHPISLCK